MPVWPRLPPRRIPPVGHTASDARSLAQDIEYLAPSDGKHRPPLGRPAPTFPVARKRGAAHQTLTLQCARVPPLSLCAEHHALGHEATGQANVPAQTRAGTLSRGARMPTCPATRPSPGRWRSLPRAQDAVASPATWSLDRRAHNARGLRPGRQRTGLLGKSSSSAGVSAGVILPSWLSTPARIASPAGSPAGRRWSGVWCLLSGPSAR